MLPILMSLSLILGAFFLAQVLVLKPLELVGLINIPTWLGLAVVAAIASWCFGE